MRRIIATVPIDGAPDRERFSDIETVFELDGWRNVLVVAQPIDDAATRWEAKVFADDPGNLPESRCTVCGGTLIGSEVEHGTCGHCGGRHLEPSAPPSPTKARATVRDGAVAAAAGFAVGVALVAGIILMAAVVAAASWVADWLGGWARFAVAGGLVGSVAALVWTLVDPEVIRP